ncbi:hypothetical protein [Winogradskyella aurantiaca]|uniref:hypothetical protein n=1 Tax=Winogradskyella aurantiaca TaxID=2219558 RepID=UPI000E1DC370|nr:hypothetical protein [Winogradskyella aurantiaca]
MKKLLIALFLLLNFITLSAQKQTQIEGFDVTLKKVSEGTIDLYWCFVQRNYYYFVETASGDLVQLHETVEEVNFYKAKLSALTGGFGNTNELFFDLKSLQKYIDEYNASQDPNYSSYKVPSRVKWYAMPFAGITNNPFVSNPDNISNPQLGLDIEFSGNVPDHKHAGFLQVRHAFRSNKFDYQTTEFNIGYRFRFLRRERLKLFAQVKVATLNINEVVLEDEETGAPIKISNNAINSPFIIGLGGDVKVGKDSYVTFMYSEIVALFFDYQGNFPIDFVIGYKFRL